MGLYKQLTFMNIAKGSLLGFTEDEKLKIAWRINNRFMKNSLGSMKYYHTKSRDVRLEIEYMYGNKYHIKRTTRATSEPLNICGTVKDIIEIIEEQKFYI